MIIFILGIFDILAAIFCIFNFNVNISMIFASILIFKGLYTLIMTANIFDILGLIDVIASAVFFINLIGIPMGFFLNFAFIMVFLKGASSFIKL
ncbi:MAG: hypothetical protein PHN56_05170 [Candidatus Nanoarchaeia archaeon]|nr:hypothetical protein [Candidatus Nanoarchaeia archaeon]